MKMGGASTAIMGLVVVGAINWGLIGAFDWDLVNTIFGSWPMVVRIVYILVGLAGLWVLYDWFAKKE
jgi:uncharacterized membrane protein YuzA (DUF378 family)